MSKMAAIIACIRQLITSRYFNIAGLSGDICQGLESYCLRKLHDQESARYSRHNTSNPPNSKPYFSSCLLKMCPMTRNAPSGHPQSFLALIPHHLNLSHLTCRCQPYCTDFSASPHLKSWWDAAAAAAAAAAWMGTGGGDGVYYGHGQRH